MTKPPSHRQHYCFVPNTNYILLHLSLLAVKIQQHCRRKIERQQWRLNSMWTKQGLLNLNRMTKIMGAYNTFVYDFEISWKAVSSRIRPTIVLRRISWHALPFEGNFFCSGRVSVNPIKRDCLFQIATGRDDISLCLHFQTAMRLFSVVKIPCLDQKDKNGASTKIILQGYVH